MFLPKGTIYLINGATGEKENVMSADLIDMADFKSELKYLFEKCGYDIKKYIEAVYVNGNNKTVYKIILDELY